MRALGGFELLVPLVVDLPQLGVARIDRGPQTGVITDEVLGLALLAVGVLGLMRGVVLLHLGRRDGDVGNLARRGIENVLDAGAFADAAILRLGRLRRHHDGALQRALHLVDGDLARQLLFELRRRLETHHRHVAVVELLADELAVGVERRHLQDLLADLLGRGGEVKAPGLLQQEMLIDQRVEHLLGQPHLGHDFGRERLLVHLLVLLLHVIERALELARRDGLAVDARRVGTRIGGRSAAGATGAPVDEDEEDEDRNNGDQDPFEVLKAIAHQLEHVDETSVLT